MIRVTTAAGMSEIALRLLQAGDTWHAPILRPCIAGEMRTAFVQPGQSLPLALLEPRRDRRPLVIVLAGDGNAPAGPGDFPQALRFFRWAGFVLIHAAAGLPQHYELAAEAARQCGRVVIAETASDYLKDWCAFRAVNAAGTPGLIIATPDGQPPHPIQRAPAGTVIQ